jgi:hypothetical protein
MKFQLPAHFTDITLKEYLAWYSSDGYSRLSIFIEDTHKMKLNARDNAYQYLCELFDNEVPQFNYRVEINGKRYGFVNDWDAFSFGEWVDTDTYSQDFSLTAHKLMSVLYRPIIRETKETYEIEEYAGSNNADIWLDTPASWFLGALLFFSRKRKEYLTTSAQSLLEVMSMSSTSVGDGMSLSSALPGKTSSKWTKLRSYLLDKCSRIWRTVWIRKENRAKGLDN